MQLQGKLDDPRIADRGGNHTERRTGAGGEIVEGLTEFRSVGEIEKLGAEIKAGGFGKREGAQDAEVQIALAGASQNAHAAVAETGAVADSWRTREGGRIEVAAEARRDRARGGRI